jgi:hypothetical protein
MEVPDTHGSFAIDQQHAHAQRQLMHTYNLVERSFKFG